MGRIGSRHNSFAAIRLIAALSVLAFHSFTLAGRDAPLIGNGQFAASAVLVFFGVSGFLTMRSWSYEPRVLRFVSKRALRIYPALLVVVALMVFVLGPLVSTLSLSGYASSAQTWHFALMNAVSLHIELGLPGVFAHNPYPDAVNLSLWTLPGELAAYAAIALAGCVGLLRRPRLAAATLLAVAVLVPGLSNSVVPFAPAWVQAFMVGAILYVLRDHVPWNGWLGMVMLAAFLVSASTGTAQSLAVVAAPYCSIYFAYRFPTLLGSLTRRGDFSYGIYLYAFPIQQLIALWLGRGVTPYDMLAISLPVTCGFGVLSWRLVENRALSLKTRGFRIPGTRLSPPQAREALTAAPVAVRGEARAA